MAIRARLVAMVDAVVCLGSACIPVIGQVVDPAHPCSPSFETRRALFVIHPAARTVFQRDAVDRGRIEVSGTYDESIAGIAPTAIEARWGDGVWTSIDANPQAGAFAGSIPDQSALDGRQDVEVRFANAPQIAVTIAGVGIGDQIVVAGQSNAVMWLATRSQSSLGPLLRPAAFPFDKNPLDPDRVAWANDPLHSCLQLPGINGSVYPALMDRITNATGVPILFIAGAASGLGIGALQPGIQPPNGDGFTPLVNQIHDATAGQSCPRLMLFFQGESDVGWRTTAEYTSLFLSFDAALQEQMHCEVPILVGVIGAIETAGRWGSYADVEAIRAALRALPGTRSHLYAGPETADLPLAADGLHFGDAAAPALLERYCNTIDASGILPCH